jgi:hypothetical protein
MPENLKLRLGAPDETVSVLPVFEGGYNSEMAQRQCHHCKQLIEPGEAHDCWTTTEAALTAELSEDLKDAYERLRETAAAFGDQRIYASGTAIMFSRDSCYFFVRPRRSNLQVCIFLGRAVKAPQVRRVERTSKSKLVNIVHITHRDEVESPFVDWLREAYDLPDTLKAKAKRAGARARKSAPRSRADGTSLRSARARAARSRSARR